MEHVVVNSNIDTVEKKIVDFIHRKGFKIFDNIDQQKEASNVGLKIPETRLIIFGNPKVGTLLMQENDDVTFELPIKILLIEKNDQTKLIYRDPYDFPGNNRLKDQGKKIIEKMHYMYQEMMETIK